MTREEADNMAKSMSYRQAIYNALHGRCIPYRKATKKKLFELLEILEAEPCEDAVSKKAVLNIIEKHQSMWDITYSCVENLSAVNPARPKGE